MNKRPKEVEEAMRYILMYGSVPEQIWNDVLEYIEQLERSEQELLNELERMADDDK